IRELITELAPLSAAKRRQRHPCLGLTRSAIMVQGALSYATLLEELGLSDLRVNGYGAKLGGLLEYHRAQ
ncbi:MAG: hypothetical protein KDB53_10675, partial [Planctomycetes bacterium]|nr:hypothetical protein [Planctomycetota bacterium]